MNAASAPAVSVIIPTYNTAQYIGNALDSVFAQTVQDFEIIVINDGSPDTPQLTRVLAAYGDRVRYIVQDNSGVSAARNAGVRAARAPLIATLDSDDSWEPDYLEVQLATLAADPTLDVVYPNAWIVGDHPHAGRLYMDVCPSHGPVTFEAIVTQRCNVFTSVLARRDMLLRAGLYDEQARAAEDFELWVRVVAAGGRIGYHRRPLVRFSKRRGSLSSDPVWMTEQGMQVYDKLARVLDLTPEQRHVLDDRRAYFRAMLALNKGKRAFFRLDAADALPHLREANRYFRSWKLSIVCALLRFTPNVLLTLYRWRDRLVIKASTQF
jgi:glycosyltransferase involved in cell wall biosynthesis